MQWREEILWQSSLCQVFYLNPGKGFLDGLSLICRIVFLLTFKMLQMALAKGENAL
jgi:hypothetical protein